MIMQLHPVQAVEKSNNENRKDFQTIIRPTARLSGMTRPPLQPRACMLNAFQVLSSRFADPCFFPGQQDIAGFPQGGQQDCQLDVIPFCMVPCKYLLSFFT